VSCAKTTELFEMEFGMLSQMGPGNMYLITRRCRCPHEKVHFWDVWPIALLYFDTVFGHQEEYLACKN